MIRKPKQDWPGAEPSDSSKIVNCNMLKQLQIQNYAIIDEISIDFSGKLNVITGETGAGKSILAGALAIASRKRPSYQLLVGVTIAFGALILAVAAAPSLPVAIVLLVPMGVFSIMFIATANSLLQLHSTAAMRGRVMALWAMVFLGSTPIGSPLIGSIAAVPENLVISASVGPVSTNVLPCRPSVSHGTSDAGLPERSGVAGWAIPGAVLLSRPP